MSRCPVCGENCEAKSESGFSRYKCVRCGTFVISNELLDRIDNLSLQQKAIFSHRLRRAQHPRNDLFIGDHNFDDWCAVESLPTAAERLDRLVILIGDNQPSPAESASISVSEAAAWIGMEIIPGSLAAALGWLLEQDETRHLIIQRGGSPGQAISLRLTMAGWQRYEALKRAKVLSRTAFMAMKFGDAELNNAVDMCFRPAVSRAGFELRDLQASQPAGLIDDHIRIALRTSRFAIADLSHNSRGAYWEAGFAEGLGRPVI